MPRVECLAPGCGWVYEGHDAVESLARHTQRRHPAMKLVLVDNFNRDNVSDVLLDPGPLLAAEAERQAKDWNAKHCTGDYAPRFCRAVPHDQPLFEWEP